MLNSLFNQYKIKRRLGRKMSGVKNAVKILSQENEANSKDFSWRGSCANPYGPKKRSPAKHLKAKLVIIITAVAAILLILCCHPFFRISDIQISGAGRIQKNDIRIAVEGIIFHKKWHVLPQNSFIFADIDEIKDIVKTKFPINSIVVRKKFPNHLDITIDERLAAIIYDNGKQFSYVDSSGSIIEIIRNTTDSEWKETIRMATSTNPNGTIATSTEIISRIHKPDVRQIQLQFGQYPIVYDEAGKDGSVVNQRVLAEEHAKNIIGWNNSLKIKAGVLVNYFAINSEIGDMAVKTKEGWEIRSKLNQNFETQIENLLLLLKTKVNKNKGLSYIDLRYESRFYWQ